METIIKYLETAQQHDICSPYANKAKNCKTKKQFFDLLLDVNGMTYFGKSIVGGWGVSVQEFQSTFANFLNGKYIKEGKYSAVAYCNYDKDIIFDKTLGLFYGCHCVINIPKNCFCEVHVIQSNCTFVGEGRVNIYAYDSTIVRDTSLSSKTIFIDR